jgi:DNA-binding transcriptional ArsR family regulator
MKGFDVSEPAPFRLPVSPSETVLLAKYFRGLGDPTRLHILELLAEQEWTVGELVDELGQAQPKVSNHLACLRWCGFVNSRQEGRFVYYRLAEKKVARMIALARELLRSNEEHVALCSRIDLS